MKQKYVVGFMFDPLYANVLLIRKTKPEWQAGLLNGIGGKTESEEAAHHAMAREFLEETGIPTLPSEWARYGTLVGDDFDVALFAILDYTGQISNAESKTDEIVASYPLFDVIEATGLTVPNLGWLLLSAKDYMQNGKMKSITATY